MRSVDALVRTCEIIAIPKCRRGSHSKMQKR